MISFYRVFAMLILGIQCSLASAIESSPEMKVNLIDLRGGSDVLQERVRESAQIMAKVLNSSEFQNEVLKFTCPLTGKNEFLDRDGLPLQQTPGEVLETIRLGREDDSSSSNSTADIRVRLEFHWLEVGHYTDGWIVQNTRVVSGMKAAEISGNLTHEWMHALGFEHSYKRSKAWPCTVPYAVGALAGAIAEKLF